MSREQRPMEMRDVVIGDRVLIDGERCRVIGHGRQEDGTYKVLGLAPGGLRKRRVTGKSTDLVLVVL